jgi:hypothetical protein
MNGSNQSNFFLLNDTLYHTYTSGEPIVPFSNSIYGGTRSLKVYLTKFVNLNGNWSTSLIDSFPRINYSVYYQNVFRAFDLNPDSTKFILFTSVEVGRLNIPGVFQAAEKKILTISPSGFSAEALNLTTLSVYFLYSGSAYSDLTKSIYSYRRKQFTLVGYIVRNRTAFLSGGNISTMIPQDSMLFFSPGDSNLLSSGLRIIRVDPSQRYLFVSMAIRTWSPPSPATRSKNRVIRFD